MGAIIDVGGARMTALGDANAAVAFLQTYRPTGPWLLSAIHPENGSIESALFKVDQTPQMRVWIQDRQGAKNLYHHVNRVTTVPERGKAKINDVELVEYLHADIDPVPGDGRDTDRARILKMLNEMTPSPTFVVDSGNGYNVY